MDTKGKKVLVVGAGLSGIAAAELLVSQGEEVVLYDANTALTKEDILLKASQLAKVHMVFGQLQKADMEQFRFAVLSPGVPTDLPMVCELRALGVAIWGEIELAYHYAKGKLAAITGTNGKTTTTTLLGEIMKSNFEDVKVVGNIGIPYTSIAAQTSEETVTVAEISSFQLETIHTFCPDVSVILNITPDHLNRHHTIENYIAAKESITKNQKPGQTCVLNYEDHVLREFGNSLPSMHVIYFSSRQKLKTGLYLEGDTIFLAADGDTQKVIDVQNMHLLGVHNYENVMAAVAAAIAFGVPLKKIQEVLQTFQAVAHRIEYVAQIDGVRYYNDSKATNPDAAIKGIEAMECATYLIGGGYDKQSEYGDWIRSFDGRVKELVLIGDTKEKIAKACKEHGFHAVIMQDTLQAAVSYCRQKAQPGEAVLLSPACASWDMFQNYEERGDLFKEIVHRFQG